jgi:hypothetical protein
MPNFYMMIGPQSLNPVTNVTLLCEASSDGKVWLRCNNWYMKSTKSDAAAGRERSSGIWMGSYADYLKHVLGNEGGNPEELLNFARVRKGSLGFYFPAGFRYRNHCRSFVTSAKVCQSKGAMLRENQCGLDSIDHSTQPLGQSLVEENATRKRGFSCRKKSYFSRM